MNIKNIVSVKDVFENIETFTDSKIFGRIVSEEIAIATLSAITPTNETPMTAIDDEEQKMMHPENPVIGIKKRGTLKRKNTLARQKSSGGLNIDINSSDDFA